MSTTVITESKDGYPELEEKKDYILKLLTIEEDNFNKTIDQGLKLLSDLEEGLVKDKKNILSGEDAFKLYDTYGFPLDLTKEILEEKGFAIDEEGFAAAMNVQRETARSARAVTNYMGADETVYLQLNPGLTSVFVGYEKDEADSTINALTTETEVVTELVAGQRGTIFTAETPFYATSGGQAADAGLITTADAEFEVEDTIKLQGGKIGHVGIVTKGMFKADETVHLAISKDKRGDTRKNHSATHLLQKALRLVLGSHVEQAGSFVNEERLRFDFTHFSALTKEEISKVEALVNEQIQSALPVNTNIMTIEEAKKTGAMALFGEKYGDSVRVVTMGEFSKELCGGTHVANTSSILIFKIISETGVAAGVRRIEALTGKGVFKFYEELERELLKASRTAKTEPAQLSTKIEGLQEEIKALQSENEKLKNKLAKDALGDVMNQVKEVSGVKLLAARVEGVDVNNLRNLGDQLKDKLGEGVIILASPVEDKVNLIVMVTDTAIAKGAHAGNLIKELAVLVGGGGGGRPNLAQAGGKNPAGIDALLEAAPKVLEKQIQ